MPSITNKSNITIVVLFYDFKMLCTYPHNIPTDVNTILSHNISITPKISDDFFHDGSPKPNTIPSPKVSYTPSNWIAHVALRKKWLCKSPFLGDKLDRCLRQSGGNGGFLRHHQNLTMRCEIRAKDVGKMYGILPRSKIWGVVDRKILVDTHKKKSKKQFRSNNLAGCDDNTTNEPSV